MLVRLRTDAHNAICQACVDRINSMRIANGLEPIVPEPDTYDSVDENELPYV
jgi:hypothetical protein